MIKLAEAEKIYSTTSRDVIAFQQLNLELNAPCYVSIVGPSGCGKSTLLNILAGYDFLTGGEYYFEGLLVEKENHKVLEKMSQKIGMVFQDYKLLEYLNVKDNLLLPSLYNGKKPDWDWIDKLGIGDCLKHYPSQLSGGQKQRVALGRILMYDKTIILADEPTGALDYDNRENLLDLFDQLYKQGTSIILVTHDYQVAKRTRQQIAFSEVEDEFVI